MYTLRAIRTFLAIGWFVLLLTACSAHNVPAVATNQTVRIPLGTTFLTPQSDSSVFSVAWSPDGKRITSASFDHTVQVCDAMTGEHLLTYRGHTNYVWAVAWSPDGKHIASAGMDDSVQVWDATTGERTLTYKGHSNAIQALAWSPDGTRIASGSWDTTVQIWDAKTGRHLFTYQGHSDIIGSLAWSPDGGRIASVDDQVRVWQAR